MPKTKISEYSATNSSNTDIEGINIDEGCPPSSINNAIRELMVHLKEFQTGASGDAFTFAGGTLMSGTNTISGAAVISGNINSSGTNTFSGTSTFNSSSLKLAGSSSGAATLNAPAAASTNTYTLPPDTSTLGYRNIPAVGTKTGSYTLATTDVGEYVQIGSGGSITIPDATFAEGDVISIFNNTSAGITITCTITTAYIAGTDADKATVSLATRGVATILFISGTVCVITGNVS